MLSKQKLATLQEEVRTRQAVARACAPLQKRIARLEAKLAAAEKEWKDNPAKYKFELYMEEKKAEQAQPKPARAVSDYGVMFKMQHDGLDRWRKRFLGSPKDIELRALLHEMFTGTSTQALVIE